MKMYQDALENGIPEDDTNDLGYRSVWKFER